MGENKMKYNMKNPGVKRILQELKEMQSNPSHDFMSLPLEENIFEWQFAIRGAVDTEFEGGIYHGRIQLPADYPFKPPSFMLLTPNGRFETQTKICLSISNHHPEHWQPSWSVRTALVALIAFMPTNPNGALGSLDYKKEERRILAIKSRDAAPTFGTPDRQKLIDEIHEYMLSKASPVPELNSSSSSQAAPPKEEDVSITTSNNKERGGEETNQGIQEGVAIAAVEGSVEEEQVVVEEEEEEIIQEEVAVAAAPLMIANSRLEIARQAPHQQMPASPRRVGTTAATADDRIFTWAAVGLTIAILVLLLKKFIKASGYGALFMDGS